MSAEHPEAVSATTKYRRVNVEITEQTDALLTRFAHGHPRMRGWLLQRMIEWATKHVDEVIDEFSAEAAARTEARRRAQRRKHLQVVR